VGRRGYCGVGHHNFSAFAQVKLREEVVGKINFASVMQYAGVGSVGVGLVLSFHHIAAAAALIGGGVAYYIGKKLRGQ
jgi:hypothetical protein